MSKKTNEIKWYESGDVITTFIIITILAAILCSQSFAVVGDSNFSMFTSVINHNSVYFVLLAYFVLLKTKFGKKYFNYLNVCLILFYVISTVTSLLTLIQSFSLNTIIDFLKCIVLLLYLFHTMFRDTRVWNDLKLGASPFNEIKNDSYYYALLVLVVFGLAVNLISTLLISGLFIPVLDALYLLLFGRYIYLYREYLDYHRLDADNDGNFDEIKKSINENINEALDKTQIDDAIVAAAGKVKDTTKDLLDKTDIDEKIVDLAEKTKDKIKEKTNKTKSEKKEKTPDGKGETK